VQELERWTVSVLPKNGFGAKQEDELVLSTFNLPLDRPIMNREFSQAIAWADELGLSRRR
jgi:hypothetical protein